jgi:hypothetical protein
MDGRILSTRRPGILFAAENLNRRYYRRLIASLSLTTLCAAVLTTSFLYTSYRGRIISRAKEYNATILRQAAGTIDEILTEIYANAFVNNAREIEYHSAVDIFTDVNRFNRLVGQVMVTAQNNRYATNYLVYYEHEGLLFGSSEPYRLVIDRPDGDPIPFWWEAYRSRTQGFSYLHDQASGESYLTIMNYIPEGVVIAATPGRTLSGILDAYKGRYVHDIYLLNRTGHLVDYTGTNQLPFYRRYLQKEFRSGETAEAGGFYIEVRRTDSFDWTVVSAHRSSCGWRGYR